jgi:hypothetical protein
MTPRSRQPQRHLKTIINQPLERRQRPNHQNPNRQPIPQSREPNIPINPSHRLTSALSGFPLRIKLRDHDVCGMRDDCAGDTGDVAAEEGDTGLLEPVVGGFRLSERFVDLVDGCLEGGEFAHCVGDLPAPEGVEAFVQATVTSLSATTLSLWNWNGNWRGKVGKGRNEPSISFCLNHFQQALSHRIRERRQRRLHPDLNRLERTQRNISQELRTCAGAQENRSLVHVRERLLAVQVLEHFIKPVLSTALETVADECGGPAEEDAADAFVAVDHGPCLHVGLVELGVYLAPGFDEIQGCDGCVGWSAC